MTLIRLPLKPKSDGSSEAEHAERHRLASTTSNSKSICRFLLSLFPLLFALFCSIFLSRTIRKKCRFYEVLPYMSFRTTRGKSSVGLLPASASVQ